MIYLIGGAPKCGKTTLAKKLSKSFGIPWVSTDTLQCVIKPYMAKKSFSKKFPTNYQRGKNNDEKYSNYSTSKIIKAYQQQAKTVYQAIDMFCICEITDGNDFIIEGYHIEPKLAEQLQKKYKGKIKSIFLVKIDENKFINNINKTTTPNDWIVKRTKNKSTYNLIAKMICEYGKFFRNEANKRHLKIMEMDNDFNKKIGEAINYLK